MQSNLLKTSTVNLSYLQISKECYLFFVLRIFESEENKQLKVVSPSM